VNTGKKEAMLEGCRWNYTYNLGDFFEWALEKRLPELNGEEAWVVKEKIIRAFDKIQRCNKESLKKYEPENGWGSVLGATIFLAEIAIACAENPGAIFSV